MYRAGADYNMVIIPINREKRNLFPRATKNHRKENSNNNYPLRVVWIFMNYKGGEDI